jgi:hypothetical protein
MVIQGVDPWQSLANIFFPICTFTVLLIGAGPRF